MALIKSFITLISALPILAGDGADAYLDQILRPPEHMEIPRPTVLNKKLAQSRSFKGG